MKNKDLINYFVQFFGFSTLGFIFAYTSLRIQMDQVFDINIAINNSIYLFCVIWLYIFICYVFEKKISNKDNAFWLTFVCFFFAVIAPLGVIINEQFWDMMVRKDVASTLFLVTGLGLLYTLTLGKK